MTYENDAWKLHDELLRKYTKVWQPRQDLKITAVAWDRGVELEIGEKAKERDSLGDIRFIWHSAGKRNVRTMREVAYALLEAADFVEESNPGWADAAFDLGNKESLDFYNGG